MIVALSIVFSLYFLCILVLKIGFRKHSVFPNRKSKPKVQFSIIVPFRNEAENLPALLRSISQLNYPHDLFEVIFINDTSEDNSAEIIYNSKEKSGISIKLFENKRRSNSPKKDAISEGIKNAKFDWIVTTDADCELLPNWLRTIDSFIQNTAKGEIPKMICGPVLYKPDGSFIQDFQLMDCLSLMSVTIGSFGLNNPILNNGANLIYQKDAFLEVKGFSGNDHIASGDDIFLMEKFKKVFPGQVFFLNSEDAVVYTKPQPNWKNIIIQRIRWASKTSKQKNITSQILGLLVFLTNICLLAMPFLMIFNPKNLLVYILLAISKIGIDFIFIREAGKFFKQRISLSKFSGMSYLYAIVVVMVVFGSLRGSYVWKGRRY